MKKLLTRFIGATLGLAMAMGICVGVANMREARGVYATIDAETNEVAYTVSFTKGANDSGTTAPSISSGGTYATIGTTSKAYARTKGLHLGSSSEYGSQIINFTSGEGKGQIKATYISVYAIQVDSGQNLKTTVTYTDSTTTVNTTATGESLSYIDISLNGSKTISSVKFETTKKTSGRVAVDSFIIYKAKSVSKTVTDLLVLDNLAEEIGDGDEIDVDADGAESVTTTVTCDVSYSPIGSDGDVTISSDPAVGCVIDTDDNVTYSFTFTKNDDYEITIEATADDTFSISFTYHVSNIVTVVYRKVTNASQLKAGQNIIIGNTDGSYVMVPYSSGNNCLNVSSTPNLDGSIDRIKIGSGFAVLTLGGSHGAWTLTDKNNNIYYGTSGKNNLQANTTTNHTWSISIDKTTFEATITDNTSGQWIAQNSSTKAFSTYGNNGQWEVAIYMINPPSVSNIFSEKTTESNLFYHYSKDGENDPVISNAAIRFGGKIDKLLWGALNGTSSNNISGYGIMLSESAGIKAIYDTERAKVADVDSTFTAVDGKSYKLLNGTSGIKCFYNAVSTAPADDGDNYYWYLTKSVAGTVEGMTTNYTAIAFIRTTSDELVFLTETTKSLAQVAADLIAADNEYTASTGEGSLGYIAGLLA